MSEQLLTKSEQLFHQAEKHLPGGVNNPDQAFKSVGGKTVFMVAGRGAKIFDADRKQYLDYVCSWGSLILGHLHLEVKWALERALSRGISFGAPTEMETELALLLKEAFPFMQKVRITNSGTESVMTALRLARAFTGKEKVIKLDGCYHGHIDDMMTKAGAVDLIYNRPTRQEETKNTLTAPFNNLEAVSRLIESSAGEIAALILEPIPANIGVIPPAKGYLEGLRTMTKAHGILLIFDEVTTGFRVAYGGAYAMYGIEPDLICLGKIIGGGLPCGAFGGKAEIMELLVPDGSVYHAGTFSGNSLTVTAGLTVIKTIKKNTNFYETLEKNARILTEGLEESLQEARIPYCLNRIGSLWTIFFTPKKVIDYETAKTSDKDRYSLYFKEMLTEGIYLSPCQWGANYLSSEHSEDDLNKTKQAHKKVVSRII